MSMTAAVTHIVRTHRAIPIIATFSVSVHGLTADDVSVTNGDVSNFAGRDGDSVYAFDVTPNAVGVVYRGYCRSCSYGYKWRCQYCSCTAAAGASLRRWPQWSNPTV